MPLRDEGLAPGQRGWAIFAISFGTALVVIDNAIATIALPTISRSLGVSPSSTVTIVTIYQVVLLMALLPLSALGDKFGHKRLYQGGQLAFLGATFLCVFASNLTMLIIARACQALSVAAVLAVSAALLRRIYPASQLGRGLGLNSIIIGSAGALAPTIGGFILSEGSWRWVFAAAAPFAILSLLLGRNLPDPSPGSARFDLPGALLCALMFGALFGGLESVVHGASLFAGLILGVLGLVTAVVFVRRELARPSPILPVDLLARPVFALSTVAALMTFSGLMTFTLSLPFRLHAAYDFSPAEIGTIMAAWPLAMMAVAPLAGFLSDRAPKGLPGCIGMGMTAASCLLMAFLPPQSPGYALLVAPLLLGGAGAGLFIAPNSHLLISSAPPTRSASAGALNSTTRLVGSALGGTMVAALLAWNHGEGPGPALIAALCTAVSAICCFINFLSPLPPKPAERP